MTLKPSALVISKVGPPPGAALGLTGDPLLTGDESVADAAGGVAEPLPPQPVSASPDKATRREPLRNRRPASRIRR